MGRISSASIARYEKKQRSVAELIESFIGEPVAHWPWRRDQDPPTRWRYNNLASNRRMIAVVRGRKVVRVFPVVE